ncbi:MAG: FAD-dependent oxidoreductase [Lachnospira sp.]
MVKLSQTDYEKMVAHAESELPDEACGLIAGRIDGDDKIIEKVYLLTNIDHSNEHFSLDPKEQLAAVKDMRANGLKPLGNWHSHPESPSRPSEEDKRLAYDSSASYLILSLMDRENPVLNSFHIEGDVSEKRNFMWDSLIIGSGPAGLGAAIYGKRAGLSVLVAEKEYMGTGQIAESGQVDNYLGLVGKSGYDLGEIFLEDAKKLGAEFYEGEAVAFEKKENSWSVSFENGEVVEAKTVIYGAGAKHRPLGLPEEADYAGKGISYCAICDGAFYKGKTAVVVGGGDTALDDALYLSDICTRVYLVHRRDEFRGSARTLQKIREKENITVITNAVITAVSGEKKVEEVTLNNGTKLKTDGVFVAVGMIPHTEHLKDFLELDTQGYVVADETGKTSQDGFFVAGDVRTKHLRQVITAVADGANAAVSASEYIRQL